MVKEIKTYWNKEKKTLKEHYFKNGERHGFYKCWYSNGQSNYKICKRLEEKRKIDSKKLQEPMTI